MAPEYMCELVSIYVNWLSSSIYSYFSVIVSFFKATLYKLHTPITTVFKGQFIQEAGVMKLLLLQTDSLIPVKN